MSSHNAPFRPINGQQDNPLTSIQETANLMLINTEHSLTNDITQIDAPNYKGDSQVEEGIDINTYLRSVPASFANKTQPHPQGLTTSHSLTRVDDNGKDLENYNRLGLQLPTEMGEKDNNYVSTIGDSSNI
jgi:hypothetical protein